jgi:pSer/pThr/pTyr-binding forkhead associated (FHA) protein
MFALEITFGGATPTSETVFIRRSVATIGSRDVSEVVIDEMQGMGYELQVSRQLGRAFKVIPVMFDASASRVDFLEGTYEGETFLDLGPVALRITAIDIDLLLKDAEASDRAGLRVLRQSCSSVVPRFPALVMRTPSPMAVSFAPEQPVVIGRARQCSLRLDNPAVSDRHARVGFESGRFWVEDLGSSTGTFVNNQQISGRVEVAAGSAISLGGVISLVGVLSDEQANEVLSGKASVGVGPAVVERKYPALVSLAEGVRPARLVLNPGGAFVLGRDQASDMWLGVPHISRRHCSVEVSKAGLVRILDTSTNGTLCDGVDLLKSTSIESSERPLVLDFGGNVTVALCYNDEQEQSFVALGGASSTFVKSVSSREEGASGLAAGRKRERRTTTWIQDPQEFLELGEESSKGLLQEFRRLYRALSTVGRVVLGLAVVGIVTVVTIIGAVLVSGIR